MATVANVATTFDADGVLHGAGEAARRRFFDDVATLTDPRAQLLAGPAWDSARGPVLNALQLPHDPDPRLAEHARDLDAALRHVAGRLIANTEVTVDDQGRAARREDRRRPARAWRSAATGAGEAEGRRRTLATGDPTAGVARPRVDPDYTATVGLSREQGRALIAAADADSGRARLRSAAVIRLLLHNALRVDEALGADLADLGTDRGHQVLTVLGKGNRRAKVALTPATLTALQLYLDARAAGAGLAGWRGMSGPLLVTTSGGRMRPSQLWELVRRLAAAAGISEWDRLSAHSLRHTGITMALDAGVPLRDVQDYARHRDARTTRRYDHSRDSLDRSAAYAVAAYLG
jgi:integrase